MNNKIRKILQLLNQKIWFILAKYINDELYLKFKTYYRIRKKLNLENPIYFYEKLQWLKLNDRKEIYHSMVDKYEVKKFISDKIGDEYIIPTLSLYDNLDEINLDELRDKFIIKNTHDSGCYYICHDKNNFDLNIVKNKLSKSLKNDYSIWSREWPYKGLRRRIIVEPLLESENEKYLLDYKFYTFNGEPKIFYITTNRGEKSKLFLDFFDINGMLMDLTRIGYKNNPHTPKLPKNLKKMVEISRILAKDTYHLRVDFYEVNDKLYIGELTFFNGGGFLYFMPEKYNKILGDWIKLPIDN